MGTFDTNGYTKERLDEWVTKFQNVYYGIFGTNYDISADTQDGQLVAALAELCYDEDEKCEAVSKAFIPSEADGNSLSALVTLNGIKRNESSKSTVSLTLTGTDGTVVEAGSLVRNEETDAQFETDSDVTISSGTATVNTSAVDSGAIISVAGSLTIIDSVVSGWDTVTNNNDATVGNDEESDAELRVRRRQSVAISSEGNVDSVHGALLELDDVLSAVVVENRTDVTDSNGVTKRAIAAIVEGGDDYEIAETIWQKKSGGCNTYGSTPEDIFDNQGFTQTINFSRPIDVNVYIDATVVNIGSFPSDGADQIKAAIISYFEDDEDTRLGIGDDVIYSQIYIPIMSVGGLSVTALTLGITASPTGTGDLTIQFDEIARFDTSRITVTES